MPDITVLYFAHLRDQRGVDSERIVTSATTVRDLYQELVLRHGLTLPERSIVVAVNEAMVRWDAAVAEGDTVVFLPPISGG